MAVHTCHARVLERVAKSQFVPGRCGCQKSSASLMTLLKRSTPSVTLALCACVWGEGFRGQGSRGVVDGLGFGLQEKGRGVVDGLRCWLQDLRVGV